MFAAAETAPQVLKWFGGGTEGAQAITIPVHQNQIVLHDVVGVEHIQFDPEAAALSTFDDQAFPIGGKAEACIGAQCGTII